MVKPPDKKDRLVQAAKLLFYRRGFAGTSLADVAEAAGVPAGNVYYYFKTKEQLAEAVVSSYHANIQGWNQAAAAGDTPQQRLKLWLDGYYQMSVDGDDWNCPFGRLLIDLRQQSKRLGELAATLYESMMEWTEGQFSRMSQPPEQARANAQTLVARAQGLGVLAVVLQDRQELRAHFQEIADWLDSQKGSQR